MKTKAKADKPARNNADDLRITRKFKRMIECVHHWTKTDPKNERYSHFCTRCGLFKRRSAQYERQALKFRARALVKLT